MKGRALFLAVMAAFGLLLLLPAHARPVRGWTPEELAEKAQVICTGTPISVDVTDQKVEIKLSGNDALPGRIVVAKVKVLGTAKGKVGSEIEIRFPTLDYKAMKNGGVVNGPMQIDLQTGQRYRFYLNPVPGKSWLVGALDGDFDDGMAVQKLAAQEAADGTPLLKDEAVRLAAQYVRQRRPSFKIVPKWTNAHYSSFGNAPFWTVQFYEQEPLSYPSFTSSAEILVKTDRTIDPDSWVAAGPPVKLTRELIGKRVRINYEEPQYKGLINRAFGTVEKVTDEALTLHCSPGELHLQSPSSNTAPQETLKIPSSEIRGVIVLVE